MKNLVRSTNNLIFFISLFLFCIMLIVQIFTYSATFDEPLHIFAGISYLKYHKLDINEGHPPLAKYSSALPFLFVKGLNLQYDNRTDWSLANQFFFNSSISSNKILLLSRGISLIFGIFFFYFIFRIIVFLSSNLIEKILFLLLFLSTPVFLNVFALSNTDYLLFFFSTIVLYFYLFYEKSNKFFILSILATLGFMSKFSGLLLFFFPLILLLKEKIYIKEIFLTIIFSILIVLILYQFRFTYLISSISSQFSQISHGVHTYFLGKTYQTGTFLFVLIIFFKFSIFYTIFWLFGLKDLLKKEPFIVLFILLNLIIFAFSKKQLGIRYLIPIYIPLFIWAILGLKKLLTKNRIIVFVFIAIIFLFSLRDFPNYLAYFNEMVPINYRYKIAVDSDLDWGQNLIFLKHFLKKHQIKAVNISYFGTDEPQKYFPCKNIYSVSFGKQFINDNIISNYYLISLTNYSGKYVPIKKFFPVIKNKKVIINGCYLFFKKE